MPSLLTRIRSGRLIGLRGLYANMRCNNEVCNESDAEREIMNIKKNYVYDKIDPELNLVFYDNSLMPKIKLEQMIVKWEGFIEIDKEDSYVFYLIADDGARLYIDKKMIIDAWTGKTLEKIYSDKIFLRKGVYSIEIEYYNIGAFGKIELGWRRGKSIEEVIPSRNLFSFAGGSVIITNLPKGYKVRLIYNGLVREAIIKSGIALIPIIDIIKPFSEGQLIILNNDDEIIYRSPPIDDMSPGDVYVYQEIS